jgi:hypothetical protein
MRMAFFIGFTLNRMPRLQCIEKITDIFSIEEYIVTCCLGNVTTRGCWLNTALYLAFPWPSYNYSLY